MSLGLSISLEAGVLGSCSSSNNTSAANITSNNPAVSTSISSSKGVALTKPFPELAQPVVKDPQEFFKKSCSMKIAAEEAVEAGDEAEEEEVVKSKDNHLKRAKGDYLFSGYVESLFCQLIFFEYLLFPIVQCFLNVECRYRVIFFVFFFFDVPFNSV